MHLLWFQNRICHLEIDHVKIILGKNDYLSIIISWCIKGFLLNLHLKLLSITYLKDMFSLLLIASFKSERSCWNHLLKNWCLVIPYNLEIVFPSLTRVKHISLWAISCLGWYVKELCANVVVVPALSLIMVKPNVILTLWTILNLWTF